MPRLQKLPPYRQRYLDTPDVRLHFAEIETPGVPMVLLHGIGMDWRVWQAMSRRLAPAFHLYLVDLRGHGESGKPAHGYTLAHYAADIEDMVDCLGLRGAVLVGSSLGGMVAASAEVPSDAVSRRILVDPPITGGPVRDPAELREILDLKHAPQEALADFLQQRNPGLGRLLAETMSEMWHEAADGVIEDVLTDERQYFDIEPALRGIDAATLIMRADPARGGILTADQADRAVQLLPHGSQVYLPGSGHAIHATKPEEFAALVYDFAGLAYPPAAAS